MSEPPINIDGPVSGDVFTGGKRVIDTGGGPYYENPTIAAPAIGVAALHQLPAPPADFTGRVTELADLRKAIHEQGAAISGLRGLGGVGKTALALVLANELAADYPDAQIFLDLQGVSHPLMPEAVMAHVIRAYKPVEKLPDDPAQLAAAYRSVLHGQRALLLLDNARDASQVKPLIPPPGCFMLVTSRLHFALAGLRPLDLDQLPPADAAALLLKIASRIGDQAAELAELCAFLPLALTLAGGVLAERADLAPAAYAERLRARQGRLGVLKEVESSLALSYDLLSPKLQRLWRMLAVFPADFDSAAAAAVWAPGVLPTQDRLSDLLRYSLLEFNPESRRYHLHDLARDFALRRQTKAERRLAGRQHAQYFSDVLASASERVKSGHAATFDGLALFDRERAHILAGQAWAAAHVDEDEATARLAGDYPNRGLYVLELRLSPRERIGWLKPALAAVRRLKDRAAEAAHLGNVGNAYAALGEPRQAIEYYEQWLAIVREIGDRRGEGADLVNLGLAYADLGEPRRAIEYYEQALVIAREIGDRRGQGADLGSLGLAYADLGEPRRAIEYHEQHLVIAREIGDRRGEGQALGNLGNAYADLGEPRRAIEYYQQQLVIAREIGDRRGEGQALGNLGSAYLTLGEPRRAIEHYEQQLVITREIGNRRDEANALWNNALALDSLGQRPAAVSSAESALVIYEQIEDPYAENVRRQLAEWKGNG